MIRDDRWRVGERGRFAGKRITKSVRGANEFWRARPVVERLAYFSDEIRKVGFGHEGVGPELLLQCRLGEDSRTLGDQRLQQFERFGREMNDLAAAGQLPCLVIDDEFAELYFHDINACVRDDSPRHIRRVCPIFTR
jgi:hypothetical protein